MGKVSIIIPTRNRRNLLAETMPYYLGQRHVGEILVVGDGSLADGTALYVSELRRKHPNVRFLAQNRKGLPAARNTGLDQVSQDADYIFFGEDDIIMPENFVSKLLENLEEFSSDAVGGPLLSKRTGESFDECIRRHARYVQLIKNRNKPVPLVNQTLMLPNWCLDLVAPTLFLPVCSLFRRRVFDKIRFDEGYGYNYFREETDAHLRARMKGFKFLYAGMCVSFHLAGADMEGGCHDYGFGGFALPGALEYLWNLAEFPRNFYSFLNNNRFLDKFYPYLRQECGYNHSKEYYKAAFALHCLRAKLCLAMIFLERKTSGLDTSWRTLVA